MHFRSSVTGNKSEWESDCFNRIGHIKDSFTLNEKENYIESETSLLYPSIQMSHWLIKATVAFASIIDKCGQGILFQISQKWILLCNVFAFSSVQEYKKRIFVHHTQTTLSNDTWWVRFRLAWINHKSCFLLMTYFYSKIFWLAFTFALFVCKSSLAVSFLI